ncbi:MAG: hypothetical protein ACJAWS_002105 [Oleiphilaceae bacterium]|jgi:hypothetical protein
MGQLVERKIEKAGGVRYKFARLINSLKQVAINTFGLNNTYLKLKK